MKLSLSLVCITVCLFGLSSTADPKDEVTSLPGLLSPIKFRHWSGYLNATGTKKLHYWFVEAYDNPSTKPVVLWLNGGPGCSSMEGMLNENGPFRINDNFTISYNNYTWQKAANVLYIEAPAGVGYSYSLDKNYTTDDDLVAKDNYFALKSFFKKFPEYKENGFYITGESYGGIYIPTLSVVVSSDANINFKGFAVGNGFLNAETLGNSILYFGYYHGLLGSKLWKSMLDKCCEGKEAKCNFVASESEACKNLVNKSVSIIYQPDLNEYNMYADCYNPASNMLSVGYQGNKVIYSDFGFVFKGVDIVEKHRKFIRSHLIKNLKVVPPCARVGSLEGYLNDPKVRSALHIPAFLPKFEICSDEVGMHYKRLYNDMTEQFREVLSKGHRVLVYNGDIDMACNFLGDEWFVEDLNLKEVTERKTWFYQGKMFKQIGGFSHAYEGLTFVTVRGAGHMVPQDKPRAAYEMISNFLSNKPF